jgi:hypothetical protein
LPSASLVKLNDPETIQIHFTFIVPYRWQMLYHDVGTIQVIACLAVTVAAVMYRRLSCAAIVR